MRPVRVGVLGFQGDLEEHIAKVQAALRDARLQGEVIVVKTPRQVDEVDALIIPGGESTVIGGLSLFNGTLKRVRERIEAGLPVLGTCAGLIMLARRTYDRVVGEKQQPLLSVLDVVVERNAFGRQRESFEVELEIPKLGGGKMRGVFIRAPIIREAGEGVEALARMDGGIVAVQQGKILATCFHPELTSDDRVHRYLLSLVSPEENG